MLEVILGFLGSELGITLVALVVGILVDRYLLGNKKKVFNIWADAILDTFEELGLDENQKTDTIYKILDKVHRAPAGTKDVEQVLLDKVGKQ